MLSTTPHPLFDRSTPHPPWGILVLGVVLLGWSTTSGCGQGSIGSAGQSTTETLDSGREGNLDGGGEEGQPDGGAMEGPDDTHTDTGGSPSDTDNSTTDTDSPVADTDSTTDDTGNPLEGIPATASTRRLSNVELANTYQAVFGFVPDALSALPANQRDHTFDRVSESQTVSALHTEALSSAARETADRLLNELRLDDLTDACPDAIVPPLEGSSLERLAGQALSAQPEWALCTGSPCEGDAVFFLYAPTPSVTASINTTSAGQYTISLEAATQTAVQVQAMVDAQIAATWTVPDGDQRTFIFTADLSEGVHAITFAWDYNATGSNASRLDVYEMRLEGPLDTAPDAQQAMRQGCATAYAEALASRAWRRPITDRERERLSTLWTAVVETDGSRFVDGIRALTEAIVRSPHFLYHIELGMADPNDPQRIVLDDHSMANRIAYAICETAPDAELRTAADAGELRTAAEVEAQIRRLFDQPCARVTVGRFFAQWLGLDQMPDLAKDPEVFPSWSNTLRDAMAEETRRFLDELTWEQEAALPLFFNANFTWVDPQVAELYGIPYPGGGGPVRVELPTTRAGLLTQPSLLALTAKFEETAPVHRGVFVLRRVLCYDPPPPPPGVDTTPPEYDPTVTTRQRWEEHSSNPACAGCHTLLDPVGFAFEDFDATGAHRDTENGLPIDPSGGIPTHGHPDGSLMGGAAIGRAVAEHEDTAACFIDHWFRFASGRLVADRDRELTRALADQAVAGESVRNIFIALLTDVSFRTRAREED